MPSMNILFICKYDTKEGGIAEVLSELRHYLKKRGHTTYLLTHDLRYSTKKLYEQIEDGCDPILLDFGVSKFLPSCLFRHRLKDFMRCLGIDVIHSHGVSRSDLALKLSQISNKPLMVTSHGDLNHPDSNQGRRKSKIKKILRYADYITHLTEPMCEKSQHIFNTLYKSRIIHNGIYLQSWGKPYSMRENYWIGLGRFVKQKGFAHLIATYALSVQRGLKDSLILLGDGPEREALVNLCFSHKMRIKYELPRIRFEPNTVYLLGYVQGESKQLLMKRAKLFLFPSQTDEAFSLVLLEAMAAGLPIIASDWPMTRYLRSKGMRAKLAAHDNTALWAETITALINEDTQALGLENATAVEAFALENIHHDYEKIYETLA